MQGNFTQTLIRPQEKVNNNLNNYLLFLKIFSSMIIIGITLVFGYIPIFWYIY